MDGPYVGGFVRPPEDKGGGRAAVATEASGKVAPRRSESSEPRQGLRLPQKPTELLVTTTPSLEGHPVERYLGLVTGDAIIGANVVSDYLARLTDFVGGRSRTYESAMASAKDTAVTQMQEAAHKMGANAIVGVDLDYEVIQIEKGGCMMVVSASGTAVRCR